MTDLSAFPITARWPASDPSVIQYYGLGTPNGLKVSIALEELALPYEAHRVSLEPEEVKSAAFTSLSPNGKIPAIIDPHGPGGAPIGLFESGAILLYLGEKTGRLLGADARARHEITQWLMWQMGGLGPMLGQMGFFVAYGGKDIEDPTARNRYITEARRLLGVLEARLEGRDWVCDSYSVADIAIAPWLGALGRGYDALDLVGWDDLRAVPAYLDRFLSRAAVQKGMHVPG